MKSAEESLFEMLAFGGITREQFDQCKADDDNNFPIGVKKMEEILLDAYRAGLTKAAEIAENERVECAHQEDKAYNLALKHSRESILAFRDNLTELPK